MKTQSAVTMNLPEKFEMFQNLLPKFETVVEKATACDFAKIVGNRSCVESFMTRIESATLIKREIAKLEDYPSGVVALEDYPLDVMALLTGIDAYWTKSYKENAEEGETTTNTWNMAFEEAHEIFIEIQDFIACLPEIKEEFFHENANLTIATNEAGEIVISEEHLAS